MAQHTFLLPFEQLYRLSLAGSARITQKLNPLLGSLTITHPFHPLCGQNYDILEVKKFNGLQRYSLRTDSGVICIPESWTDRQIHKLDSHMTHFDAFTLKELAQLLQSLEVSVNLFDKSKQEE
ncbi:DUF5372 family protein [Alkaliphilus metalliredigens]|uniref:DUF5372 family protein n=1 Tax=Alkaliphilus metalliredigens TaxID=208226 RepID=UPI0012ECBE80|nr:DUF5372 family protein [Alkaliphilus metalliredigens]